MTSVETLAIGLPEVGSPAFTAQLLRYVLAHPALDGWGVNPSLFSVLLLPLIVRRGGVVLDVDGRDVEAGVRVISAMTKSIFGLSTQHLTLDEHTAVEDIVPKLSHTSFTPPYAFSTPFASYDEETGRANHAPEVLVITGLEDTSSPVQMKLCDILTKKRIEVSPTSEFEHIQHEDQQLASQLRRQKGHPTANGDGDVKTHDSEFRGGNKAEERPFDPLVIWVREEGSNLPSWVVDHFMCGISVDMEDIELPPSDLDDRALIPSSYISTLSAVLPYVHIHPPLSIHISNLLSAVSSHPSLRTCLTQRAIRGFPEYVKAHRILSGSFDLPPNFAPPTCPASPTGPIPKAACNGGHVNGKGLGGGIGGVDTWAMQAGELPTLASWSKHDPDLEEETIENPYCTPANVEGVWRTLVTHRARRREEREEVMWLMKGSAGEGLELDRRKMGKTKSKGKKGLDRILDEIVRTV